MTVQWSRKVSPLVDMASDPRFAVQVQVQDVDRLSRGRVQKFNVV